MGAIGRFSDMADMGSFLFAQLCILGVPGALPTRNGEALRLRQAHPSEPPTRVSV
jgi:hypothetical protein